MPPEAVASETSRRESRTMFPCKYAIIVGIRTLLVVEHSSFVSPSVRNDSNIQGMYPRGVCLRVVIYRR